jgi:lipoprotein-anchoring transpeptidase ErfK/SrfK
VVALFVGGFGVRLALSGHDAASPGRVASTPGSSAPSVPSGPAATTTAAGTGLPSDFPNYAAAVRGGSITIRRAPDPSAAEQARLPGNDGGTPQTFLIKEQRAATDGAPWYRVLLPLRPNGTTGWVAGSDVDVVGIPYRLEIRLADFRVDLFGDEGGTRSFPIGIGTDATPTPGGEYYIAALVEPPNPNTAYGQWIFELNGHSTTVTGAFADGLLGIHGTNDPTHALGRKVSHGCIRMRNEDIGSLAKLLPLGTPVIVR